MAFVAILLIVQKDYFQRQRKNEDFDDSPGILNLIKRVFFYIPCLIIDFAEYIS